ncbi:hypothetical protein Taro_013980 [Colocasia esculenta]|uniref:Aminotransferase-like plant mobile domain-containing protein n=1 Tax=Colocasia esculenta TaxID=4460 RepID=A0A843UH25_COLES|nr:hypothetical protein [Colocasia esculenta]
MLHSTRHRGESSGASDASKDIVRGEAASWYGQWSIVSSHRFHFGATEWLMGILHHYCGLLDQAGILHVVAAALHDYPCHSGLLQALAERFNWRFNTFGTAEGEACLDLWALFRISGLPISVQFYEEVCLDDLHRDQSSGAGSYILPHSFRFMMKVWRDLARCGKDQCPSASKGTVKLSVDFKDNTKHLNAPRDDGWNPRQLPDRTYLATYLVYWMGTFVVPFEEEGLIRPELIYLACLLADGVRMAMAPTSLANIFHGLGDLTAHSSPRDRSVTLGTHYLSAWAGLLLPELCQNVSIEDPVLLFRKGSSLFMEPYFPYRFARNFGYDQATPPNANFALSARSYKGLDRHLVASSWWCYFTRHDPSPGCFISEEQQEGRVDIFYARWWSRHNQTFREHANRIKEAESARLSRTNVPVPRIASDFIRREFPAFIGRVQALSHRKARAQDSGPTEWKAYVGTLKPLVRPESSLVAPGNGGGPTTIYSWWVHFLLDYSYSDSGEWRFRYVSAGVAADEGVEYPVAAVPTVGGTPSLQAIHDLLVSGLETELSGFSDFASSMLEGGAWPQALHSAMAVTSTAALPTASPPEEGEVTRGAVGEGIDAVELVAEMMEASPPVVVLPSTTVVAGAEDASRSAAIAPPLPRASEPLPDESSDALAREGLHPPEASHLGATIEEAGGEEHAAEGGADVPGPSGVQAIGSGTLPPPPGAVPSAGFDAFPDHGVLWPSEPQSIQIPNDGGILESLMGRARSAMEASSPPSIEMEFKDLRSRHGDVTGHIETLRAGHARCHEDIAALQRTIEDASKHLAERQAASTALAGLLAEAEAEATALERGCSNSQARLSALQASLADLQRGIGLAYRFGVYWLKGFDLTDHGGLLVKEGIADLLGVCWLRFRVAVEDAGHQPPISDGYAQFSFRREI